MLMRCLIILALVILPVGADADQRARSQSRSRTQSQSPRAEAMTPPRGLAGALGPAGSERAPSRFGGPRDSWHRWPQTDRSWWRHQQFPRQPFGSYYAVPYTGFSTYAPGEPDAAPAEPAVTATMTKGLLRLDITPAVALEYFVDGVFIGSSSQLGTEFEMNAGARQVEVRARGYKSIVFDSRIDEGRVTTFRGTLEAIEQPQAPRSPGSRVMYVIPGCYIGNARPEPSALPVGCDIKKMVTRGNGL